MRKSCVEEPGCLNRVYDVKYRRWSEYNYSMKRSPWGALWPISLQVCVLLKRETEKYCDVYCLNLV